MVVVVLSKAGLQLPVMPLLEVVGNGFRVSPEQMGDTASKTGVVFAITVMSRVVVTADWPASGVKV